MPSRTISIGLAIILLAIPNMEFRYLSSATQGPTRLITDHVSSDRHLFQSPEGTQIAPMTRTLTRDTCTRPRLWMSFAGTATIAVATMLIGVAAAPLTAGLSLGGAVATGTLIGISASGFGIAAVAGEGCFEPPTPHTGEHSPRDVVYQPIVLTT